MKIIADTNLLLRAYVADDASQAQKAVEILANAELVAVGLQTLSELVWVLTRSYETSREDTAAGRTLPEPARHAATNHSLMKLVPTIPISMLVLLDLNVMRTTLAIQPTPSPFRRAGRIASVVHMRPGTAAGRRFAEVVQSGNQKLCIL